MIIDYAKPDSRWKRFRRFNRRHRLAYAIVGLVAGILLIGWNDTLQANYPKRMFRHQKRIFFIPIWRVDYPLPGHAGVTSQQGQWILCKDVSLIIPKLTTMHSPGQQTYAYFNKAIYTLDGTSNLSANQKQSLEDRIWAAAAAQQYTQLQAIAGEIIDLEQALSQQPSTAPSTQPSMP